MTDGEVALYNRIMSLQKKCPYCGSIFTRKSKLSFKQWGERKFCSQKCGARNSTEKKTRFLFEKGHKPSLETRKKISKKLKGNKNSGLGNDSCHWKGGKFNLSSGYVMIYSPLHPFKNKDGYLLEHRLVMEGKIGRYLTKKEVVHHINRKVDDNRPENLRLFKNNVKHLKWHRTLEYN